MRKMFLAVVRLSLSATPALAQKGPPPDPQKALAEAAKVSADDAKVSMLIKWTDADMAKVAANASWDKLVVGKWNDYPGKKYYSGVMTPEHYGTVLGDFVVALGYLDSGASYYNYASTLRDAAYVMYWNANEALSKGQWAVAIEYFGYAVTGYNNAAIQYANSTPFYDLAGVYLWDAEVILSYYP